MTTISLTHDSSSFNALYFNAEGASRAILFAVGSGGNPERHLPLLQHLHERGMTVIAPYFERLVTSGPDAGMLLDRAARLRAAFRHVHKLQVAGIGHSIGATLLLAMAGGNMFTAPGAPLPVVPDTPMDKLVLFAPPRGILMRPEHWIRSSVPCRYGPGNWTLLRRLCSWLYCSEGCRDG
ncbi:hypothetical protein MKQ70_03185 [Chitinophaga sedimenti]|uniref:hypothetical protein n=1 Tax=Chitinophaga sedimenti TaxID=2033606 RepID=UPI002003781C|nr:hypothetical protein [Chitinophaga sedimenti]MCK7554064.1 hypothetical protein [Chitinophaga sedimenti]